MRVRNRNLRFCETATLAVVLSWAIGGCGRTGLLVDGVDDDEIAIRVDDAGDAPRVSVEASTPTPAEPECRPDLAPIPCPGGGFRYCVAGHVSACPERCEACLPGSERVCFISYCLYWGVQTCAADGRTFGPCREEKPPQACTEVAKAHQDSPELERCCVDNGYCCTDEHDLDGDGDTSEVIGRCDEVLCRP